MFLKSPYLTSRNPQQCIRVGAEVGNSALWDVIYLADSSPLLLTARPWGAKVKLSPERVSARQSQSEPP